MIDIFDYYYVMQRGEIEDTRDLYKLLQTVPKKTSDEVHLSSDYNFTFSNQPHGLTQGRI